MGKRELLLLLGFLAFGFVVYQATAPAPDPEKESFSLSKFMGQMKAELHGEQAESSLTRTLTAEPPSHDTRLVIPEYRGTINIIGEDRHDISAELQAVVYGLDEHQAEARAKTVALTLDRKNDEELWTKIELPAESRRRPRLEMTIRVPDHLAVTLELRNGQSDVRRIASLHLGDARGKVTLSDIGSVDGSMVNGNVEILRAKKVNLTLQHTTARFEEVEHELTLDAARSDMHIEKVDGPTKLKLEHLDCDLEALGGPGTFETDHVNLSVRKISAPVTIKGERTEVKATMETAVPVTIETTDDQIDLRTPAHGVTIDARTKDGQIRVADAAREEEPSDDDSVEKSDTQIEKRETQGHGAQQIQLKLHGGGPTITLRNTRGDIVIR